MEEILKILKEKNKVIALRTDTVYGLICNANDKDAVKKIYEIKKRESKKPISIFIKDKSELSKYIIDKNLSKEKQDIIDKYWPGALTIIFNKKIGIYDYLTCGTNTIGIRIPDDKYLLELLNEVDFPLAETSCNLSGEKPYISANDIKEKLGEKVDMIVDGGLITNNVASTVVSFIDVVPKVLRIGDIKIGK